MREICTYGSVRGDRLPLTRIKKERCGRARLLDWTIMRKSSHVQYEIEYHIVWTTKYRYRILQGKVAERLREIIRQNCNSMNITIIKGSIGKEHVHVLLSCPPSLSVSRIVQQLKGKTSRALLSEYKELRKRYYGQHLWGTGYFCRSVGTVTREIIEEYIKNQDDEYEENFKIIG